MSRWYRGLQEVQHHKEFPEKQVEAVGSRKRGVAFEVVSLPRSIPGCKVFKTSNFSPKLKITPTMGSFVRLIFNRMPWKQIFM